MQFFCRVNVQKEKVQGLDGESVMKEGFYLVVKKAFYLSGQLLNL